MTWLGGAALQWIEGEPGEGGDGLNPGSRWRAGDGVLKDFFLKTHGLVVGVVKGFGGWGEEEPKAAIEVT